MAAIVLFLALVLTVSAAHKFAEPRRMADAAAILSGLSRGFGPALSFAAAGIEGVAALALLLEPFRIGGAIAACALWSGYGILLLNRRGQTLDCGCDLARRTKRVDLFSTARPFLLAGLTMIVVAARAGFTWSLDTPFAALALLALWFATAEVGALFSVARNR